MSDQDDLSGPDEGDEAETEAEAVYVEFRDLVFGFGEGHALPTGYLSAMCQSVAIEARMTDYVLETAQPSVSGLRRDLDRMLREFDTTVRNAKRGVPEFIEQAKQAIQELDENPDAEDDENPEPAD